MGLLCRNIQAYIIVSNFYLCVLGKVYYFSDTNRSYHFTIIEQVTTPSPLTCFALCEQTLECHAVSWNETFTPCVLIGNRGNVLLSSFNGSLPFYRSSLIDVISITPETVMGLSPSSHPELAFHSEPDAYYQSTYQVNSSETSNGFVIKLSRSMIVTRVCLVFLNSTTYITMHVHASYGAVYCYSPTADPQKTGVVIDYPCPSGTFTDTISMHITFRHYARFNSLKIFGEHGVRLFP